MQFIYPEFLYALAFLIIPILIHLFNFKRYKTLYFPDVSLLSTIKQRSQSTSRLKKLLILFSRLLLITSLVFAFAQPYLKEEGNIKKQGKTGVQIYLDNSFSMEAQAKEGSLFNEAKQRALTIINSYSAADKFQLLSNSFESEGNLWLNREAAIERLQSIEIDHRNRSLSEVYLRLQETDASKVEHIEQYFISDYQKQNFDLNEIDELSTSLNLIVLESNTNDNISLQDLQFDKPFHLPAQAEKLKAKVIRHGVSDKFKVPMKLYFKDQLKVPISVEFGAMDTLIAEMSFQSGEEQTQEAILAIKDYPITFDDSLYFNYDLKSKIKIIHLYDQEANSYLNRLYSGDSLFDYSSYSQNEINYSELKNSALILLDELAALSSGTQSALTDFLKNGGDLVFIPSKNPENSINEFLSEINTTQLLDLQEESIQIGEVNKEAILFDGVFESIPKNLDLPESGAYWMISNSSKIIKEDLLTLKNGASFLRKFSPSFDQSSKNGDVYLFTAPFSGEKSTFGRHALFVPTLFNIALYAQEKEELYHYLDAEQIELSNIEAAESPVHLISESIDLIPQQEYKNGNLVLRLNNTIKRAGHYQLVREGKQLGLLSLNYSRKESDYDFMDESAIQSFAKNNQLQFNTIKEEAESLNREIESSRQGEPLWKYFIILALLFMGVEILLLRILK